MALATRYESLNGAIKLDEKPAQRLTKAKGAVTQRKTDHRKYRPKEGRPTASQKLAIEQTILSAATESFLAAGYDATSIDGIARSAKVSKKTIYSRYSDKESLFRTVIMNRMASESAQASEGKWMPGDTLEQRLKQHAKIMMTLAVTPENRALDRLIVGASELHRDIIRTLYQTGYRPFVDRLATEIREYTRKGGHPAKHPERVADLLASAWFGWLRMETSERNVSAREAIAFAHQTIDLLLTGPDGW